MCISSAFFGILITVFISNAYGNVNLFFISGLLEPLIALIFLVLIEGMALRWGFKLTWSKSFGIAVFINVSSGIIGVFLPDDQNLWLIDLSGVVTVWQIVAVQVIGFAFVNTIIEVPLLLLFRVTLNRFGVLLLLIANLLTVSITFFHVPSVGYGLLASRSTPLNYAITSGDTKLAKVLVDNGANVNEYPLPLDAAIRNGYVELAKFLIARGAKIDEGVPLYLAAKYGHAEIVRILIEKGADTTVLMNSAIERGLFDVYQILIDGGAKNPDPEQPFTYQLANLIRLARQTGNPESKLQLAKSYHNMGKIKLAIQWYGNAALAGSAEAGRILGDVYRDGTLQKRDLVEAARWYRISAKSGDAYSIRQLHKLEASD